MAGVGVCGVVDDDDGVRSQGVKFFGEAFDVVVEWAEAVCGVEPRVGV